MTEQSEYDLRCQIVETCRRMTAAGINQGTAGNVSARYKDHFLITPTGMPYDLMTPEDVVEMGFDGTFTGRHRPSSEWRFHMDILASRHEVNAVVHCHSIHATSMACLKLDIPRFHYMVAVAGGSDIRCADYATYGSQALSDNALVALRDRKACLLEHHGQIALGDSLARALWLAIEVETLAKLYCQVKALGEPVLLPEDEIQRVIDQIRNKKYGVAAPIDDSGLPIRQRADA